MFLNTRMKWFRLQWSSKKRTYSVPKWSNSVLKLIGPVFEWSTMFYLLWSGKGSGFQMATAILFPVLFYNGSTSQDRFHKIKIFLKIKQCRKWPFENWTSLVTEWSLYSTKVDVYARVLIVLTFTQIYSAVYIVLTV
jgi:hypothetical protein